MEELNPQEWLNKEQAAEFLDKSEKGIQRLTASGQLIARYVQEKGYKRAYYKLEDLQHFKEHGHTAKPVTQDEKLPLDTTDKVNNKSIVQAKHSPEKIISELVGRVFNEAQKHGLLHLASIPSRTKEKPSISISEKMILTIAEASILSGRPQSELRKAFQQGKLHGVKLGKGIKVRKEDLKLYIDGLFTKF